MKIPGGFPKDGPYIMPEYMGCFIVRRKGDLLLPVPPGFPEYNIKINITSGYIDPSKIVDAIRNSGIRGF